MVRARPPADIEDMTDEEREAIADPDNAANPKAIKTKQKRGEDDDKMRVDLLAALVENPHGHKLLTWLLVEVCGMYRTSANAAHDTNSVHYREGARAVGLELHKLLLRGNPNQYMVMLAQHMHKG